MKAITYLAVFALSGAAMVSSAFSKELKGWTTDLEKALEQAKKENKSVLVEFTGSDWCPPCKMMRKEVFSKDEFVEGASKKYILVELDFPNGDEEVKKKNEPYAEKYKIDAFPTVVLLDSEGKEFNRFIASEFPKTEDFLKHLNEALEKKSLD
jgi:thiol:disulfide interchange protein